MSIGYIDRLNHNPNANPLTMIAPPEKTEINKTWSVIVSLLNA